MSRSRIQVSALRLKKKKKAEETLVILNIYFLEGKVQQRKLFLIHLKAG